MVGLGCGGEELLKARLGVPEDATLVGEDGGAQGGPIVVTNPNHHETARQLSLRNQTLMVQTNSPSLADSALSLELV